MQIKYPEIAVCGLSCRLCPRYQTESQSRCEGCKSKFRMSAGCSFITCAVKKKGIEFCINCSESKNCEKWKKHREYGKKVDSFISYQKLEDNIKFIYDNGVEQFEKEQILKEKLLKEMLWDYNEGRSKSYYCIAVTLLEIEEIKEALTQAKKDSLGLIIKEKSRILHLILDEIAEQKKVHFKLRK